MWERTLVLILCASISLNSMAQKLSLQLGTGVGRPIPIGSVNSERGTAMLLAGVYYHPNPTWSFGIERLGIRTPRFITFDPIRRDYTSNDNTIRVDPSNASSRAWLAKTRYTWSGKSIAPFVGGGVGLSTIFLKEPVENVTEISSNNLAAQLEAGLLFDNFYLSFRVISVGNSPAYIGTVAESNFADSGASSPINVRINSVYIISYHISLGINLGFWGNK
jgi:hypothetical protein